LAGYLLEDFGNGDPAALAKLLHAVFEGDWNEATWIYRESFLPKQTPPTSDQIINSMRNLKLNLNLMRSFLPTWRF